MWGGDRWQTGPDGFKSHDFMVWTPLEFADELAASNGNGHGKGNGGTGSSSNPSLPLQWRQSYTVDLT